MTEPILIKAPEEGVTVRLRRPQGHDALHFLMLHGWSGDENVMWVLESVLPEDSYIVAARGIQRLSTGGYHWAGSSASTKVGFHDFEPAISALRTTLDGLRQTHDFGKGKLLVMGFSQGAALAFAVARAGIPVAGIIALAGFVPDGDLHGLEQLPVFWGHGTHDERVPIERARVDAKRLLDARVELHYCEADVGHKLGIECARGLKEWLRGHFSDEPKELET